MSKNPIKNLLRLRPFSHNPGTMCIIPATTIAVEVFPALLRFYELGTTKCVQIGQISFDDLGPLDEFTVTCDMERSLVLVSGFQNKRPFRYEIFQKDSKEIRIYFEKLNSVLLKVHTTVSDSGWSFYDSEKKLIEERAPVFSKSFLIFKPHREVMSFNHWPKKNKERLFLGNTKKQDFDLMMKREDVRELLPFYYYLTHLVPKVLHLKEHTPETQSLCYKLEKAIQEKDGKTSEEVLLAFFKVGFTKMMIPALLDPLYQGYSYILTEKIQDFSALILFEKLYVDVRKMFFEELHDQFSILPSLPPSFHSGVLTDILTEKGHAISIEWSKKAIRRLFIHTQGKVQIPFVFQNPISSFRIQDLNSKKILGRFKNKSKITLEENGIYLLDRFEK